MLSLGLLKDKVAIVTGASQGLGEQFAKVMAKNGAKVAIAARQRKKLEALKEELEASKLESVVIEMDVLDQESIKQGIAKVEELWGIPDILVNNAGLAINKPFLDVLEEDYDSVLDTNLKGCFFCAQAVAKEWSKIRADQ